MPVIVDGGAMDSDTRGFKEGIRELLIGCIRGVLEHLLQESLLLRRQFLGPLVGVGSRPKMPLVTR